MGDKKTVSTTEIGQQTERETDILGLLEKLVAESGAQMGDLSGLARGDLSASDSDRRLIEESIGASRDMARRGAEQAYKESSALVEDDAIARGIGGSSIEAVNRAVQGNKYQDIMADVDSRSQKQEAEALMTMPFQRAGVQMNANQQLLARLTGGANPILTHDLQARLAELTRTKTEEGGGWRTIGEMGMRGAAAIGSSGASEVAAAGNEVRS